jgi:hypothetical protein
MRLVRTEVLELVVLPRVVAWVVLEYLGKDTTEQVVQIQDSPVVVILYGLVVAVVVLVEPVLRQCIHQLMAIVE